MLSASLKCLKCFFARRQNVDKPKDARISEPCCQMLFLSCFKVLTIFHSWSCGSHDKRLLGCEAADKACSTISMSCGLFFLSGLPRFLRAGSRFCSPARFQRISPMLNAEFSCAGLSATKFTHHHIHMLPNQAHCIRWVWRSKPGAF